MLRKARASLVEKLVGNRHHLHGGPAAGHARARRDVVTPNPRPTLRTAGDRLATHDNRDAGPSERPAALNSRSPFAIRAADFSRGSGAPRGGLQHGPPRPRHPLETSHHSPASHSPPR